MVPPSEAACLLQTGAIYSHRLGLRTPSSTEEIFVGIKHGAFSIYDGDAPIFHYDLEGRWQRAFIDGIHFLKGLDTSTQAIDRVREGANMVLKRRTLSYAEASDLDAQIRAYALELGKAIGSGSATTIDPPPTASKLEIDQLCAIIDRIGTWDAAAWFSHREKYLGTYGPLPFLPPDCQHAMILQATLGHAEGVAFGNATSHPHYVRSQTEFTKHVADVAGLLGRRAAQCKNIFLAGSDILNQPLVEVQVYLESIAETFAIDPNVAKTRPTDRHNEPHKFDGIHVFLDDFANPLPEHEGFSTLKSRHLTKVHLGVESGSSLVRACYHRNWTNGQFIQTVSDLKGAAIPVGLIGLLGAGGVEHAEEHGAETVALITQLPLTLQDLVVFIEADEFGPLPDGLNRLGADALTGQRNAIREGLASWRAERGVKVVAYTLDKQGTSF